MPNSEPSDPRQARLAKERERLMTIHDESENVRVDVIDQHPGSEPERYRVTFLCKGIVNISPETQEPVYGTKHQVELYCHEDFPSEVPLLRWVTPIWHPNIQHKEPKGVCVNKPAWLAGIGLDDLCRQMFEMVQYKNYHADESRPPYPLDHEVAKWVREVAEPRGIVDKDRGIFVDNRPFVKPTYGGGIKLGPGKATQANGTSEPLVADQRPRMRITGAPPPPAGLKIRFKN
jgi:ubiquitin-protein ligase